MEYFWLWGPALASFCEDFAGFLKAAMNWVGMPNFQPILEYILVFFSEIFDYSRVHSYCMRTFPSIFLSFEVLKSLSIDFGPPNRYNRQNLAHQFDLLYFCGCIWLADWCSFLFAQSAGNHWPLEIYFDLASSSAFEVFLTLGKWSSDPPSSLSSAYQLLLQANWEAHRHQHLHTDPKSELSPQASSTFSQDPFSLAHTAL